MTPLPARLRLGPVRAGGVALLAGRVDSAIDKHPLDRPVRIGPLGIDGDAQADRRVHGGPDKALHAYAAPHFPAWTAELGQNPHFAPGGFGENLTVLDVAEDAVAVGDRFRLGSALIEVTQGRQPCWKLNLRFGIPDMARRVQDSGRTGWYFRVLERGLAAPGDALALVERRAPDWTLTRLWRVLYRDRLNRDELAGMAALPALSESWRKLARRRLDSASVEDWTRRLSGG